MKIVYLLFTFFCFCTVAFAQQEYIFIGSLSLNGGGKYTYKLQVKDSAGLVRGYSITDIGGNDQTKAAVKGTIDEDGKELVFHETKILQTKSALPKDSFCYIYGRIKLKGIKKDKLLNGSFTGYRRDRATECAKGTLSLASAADMMKRFKNKNPVADSILQSAVQRWKAADTVPAKMLQLTTTKPFEASYTYPAAMMELWDDQHIDGDVVSVAVNHNIILDHYALTASHKKIPIRLSGNKADSIALIAISEGTEPSNTAVLKVLAGTDIYYLKAITRLGEPAYIILKPKGR